MLVQAYIPRKNLTKSPMAWEKRNLILRLVSLLQNMRSSIQLQHVSIHLLFLFTCVVYKDLCYYCMLLFYVKINPSVLQDIQFILTYGYGRYLNITNEKCFFFTLTLRKLGFYFSNYHTAFRNMYRMRILICAALKLFFTQ